MHPYMYMGRNVPKEGKNREKVTFYFVDTQKLICQPYKVTQSSLLVRTCSARAFQQRCCFFAVTSVTGGDKTENFMERKTR